MPQGEVRGPCKARGKRFSGLSFLAGGGTAGRPPLCSGPARVAALPQAAGPLPGSPEQSYLCPGTRGSPKALSPGGQAPDAEGPLAIQRVRAAAPEARALVPRLELLGDGRLAERAARGAVLERGGPQHAAVGGHQALPAQVLLVGEARGTAAQLPLGGRRQGALGHQHVAPGRQMPGGQQQLRVERAGRAPGPAVARRLGWGQRPQEGDVGAAAAGRRGVRDAGDVGAAVLRAGVVGGVGQRGLGRGKAGVGHRDRVVSGAAAGEGAATSALGARPEGIRPGVGRGDALSLGVWEAQALPAGLEGRWRWGR